MDGSASRWSRGRVRRGRAAAATALLAALPTALRAGPPPIAPATPFRAPGIPDRQGNALTGSEFALGTRGFPGEARQSAAVEELLRGNLPESLRILRPVRLRGPAPGDPVVTVFVMPDYLAIGSDQDHLYIPLTFPSIRRVARGLGGFVLPTPRIVDAVYRQADRRLRPIPMAPGPWMRSSEAYLEHQRKIDAAALRPEPGLLVAGHKKDVVVSDRLRLSEGRIAIYGWHRDAAHPIQPLSTVHSARYADYSHGIRLVWGTVLVGDRSVPLLEALHDPLLARVLNDEGALIDPAALMAGSSPARSGDRL